MALSGRAFDMAQGQKVGSKRSDHAATARVRHHGLFSDRVDGTPATPESGEGLGLHSAVDGLENGRRLSGIAWM